MNMEKKELNKKINFYVKEKYQQLFEVACSITNQNKEDATDILHFTVLQLLERTTNLSKIINAVERNLFVYIYVSMKFQFCSSTSEYHRLYRNSNKTNSIPVIDKNEFHSGDSEDEVFFMVQKIDSIVSDDYNEKIDDKVKEILKALENPDFTWYEKKLWKLYHLPEYLLTPKEMMNMSTEEIEKIRKTSYRKMQKQILIKHQSIGYTITDVNERIRQKLN